MRVYTLTVPADKYEAVLFCSVLCCGARAVNCFLSPYRPPSRCKSSTFNTSYLQVFAKNHVPHTAHRLFILQLRTTLR